MYLTEGEYWSPAPAIHHKDAEQVTRNINQDAKTREVCNYSSCLISHLRKKFVKGSPDRLVEANARP